MAPRQAHTSPVNAPSCAHGAVGACEKPPNAAMVLSGGKGGVKIAQVSLSSCWARATGFPAGNPVSSWVCPNWLVSEAQRRRNAVPAARPSRLFWLRPAPVGVCRMPGEDVPRHRKPCAFSLARFPESLDSQRSRFQLGREKAAVFPAKVQRVWPPSWGRGRVRWPRRVPRQQEAGSNLDPAATSQVTAPQLQTQRQGCRVAGSRGGPYPLRG